MQLNGWAGKILYIDLSSGKVTKEPLNEKWAESLIGGHATAARLAYDLIKPGIDPLSIENPIILTQGPLVGTLTPGACKSSLVTKSVSCGFIGPGSTGSLFGTNMKAAGYDGLVITGGSEKPVYIEIVNDEVKIHDASDLWGEKDIYDTTFELWHRHGSQSSVIAIGSAGERLLGLALAFADIQGHLGKDGLGAVMGAKKLKAIVVRGTNGITIADKGRFLKTLNLYLQNLRNFPRYEEWKQLGLMAFFEQYVDTGQMVIGCNFRKAMTPEQAERAFSRPLQDKYRRRHVSCPACPVGDKMMSYVPDGEFAGLESPVSTLLVLGAMWAARFLMDDPDNFDIPHAIYLHDLCNRAGIEAIAASGIMAWLVDLYDHGVITRDDLDGIEPKYNFDTCMKFMDKLLKQEGIGVTIGKGWKGAIKDIGRGSDYYAIAPKGLDIEFDPRAALGSETFSQCVRARGGSPPIESMAMTLRDGEVTVDNIRKWITRRGVIPVEDQDSVFIGPPSGFHTGRYTKWLEDWYSAQCCLGTCVRPFVGMFMYQPFLTEFLASVTGLELSYRELLQVGERSWNIVKLLNVREGFDRKDDAMPPRAFKEKLYYGSDTDPKEFQLSDYVRSHQVTPEEWEWLLDGYYDERGWDLERGWPTKEKMAELGLQDLSHDMVKHEYTLKDKTEPITRQVP